MLAAVVPADGLSVFSVTPQASAWYRRTMPSSINRRTSTTPAVENPHTPRTPTNEASAEDFGVRADAPHVAAENVASSSPAVPSPAGEVTSHGDGPSLPDASQRRVVGGAPSTTAGAARAAASSAGRAPAVHPALVARAAGPSVGPLAALVAPLAAATSSVTLRDSQEVHGKLKEGLAVPGSDLRDAVFLATGVGRCATVVTPRLFADTDVRMYGTEKVNGNEHLLRLLGAMGPGSLPLLVDFPWRNEGAVASWKLAESDAAAVHGAFVTGAADVYVNVVNALLRNPSLSDAWKRRLIVAATTRSHDLPAQVTPLELARHLAAGTSAQRGTLGALLESRSFGLDTLRADERRSLIESLLADGDPDVRIAAAAMWWETKGAVANDAKEQQQLLSIVKDPRSVADARLKTIFSMGWSRERADAWAAEPKGMLDALEAQRYEMVGRMLESAPSDANIRALLDEVQTARDMPALLRVACARIVSSTSLSTTEKLDAFLRLYAIHGLSAPMVVPFIEIASAHPAEAIAQAPDLLQGLSWWARDRNQQPQTFQADWNLLVSTEAGLLRAIEQLRTDPASYAPAGLRVVSTSTDAPTHAQRLADRLAVYGDPNNSGAGMTDRFHDDVAMVASRATTPSQLEDALSRLLPFALRASSQLVARDVVACLRLLGDPRMPPAKAVALLQSLPASAPTGSLRMMLDTLEELGIPADVTRRLAAQNPQLLMDLAPLPPGVTTPLTPRGAVLRAVLERAPSIDQSVFDAGVREFVGVFRSRPLASDADVEHAWARLKSDHNWIDGHDPSWGASVPEVAGILDAARAGAGYDALRAQWSDKTPLAWDGADKVRQRQGEQAALEALVSSPPIASPLWEGAFIELVASSPALSAAFRERFLLDALQPGYLRGTTADRSWDALSALSKWRGDSFSFAVPAMREALRWTSDTKDIFAYAPVLEDKRLAPDAAADLLLTLCDHVLASTSAHGGPSGHREPAADAVQLLAHVLAHRDDLSAEDRQMLQRAGDLVMNRRVFGSPAAQARMLQAVAALNGGTLSSGDVQSFSTFPPPSPNGRPWAWPVPTFRGPRMGGFEIGFPADNAFGEATVVTNGPDRHAPSGRTVRTLPACAPTAEFTPFAPAFARLNELA